MTQLTQLCFDDLDLPLAETTFLVVDLETTGGAAASDAITEIGAVKVRGGEVIGEFATLVNPGSDITAFITVLTGITNQMVAAAPPIGSVLPAFLEFATGCVLVAHNAPFDVGFLRAACQSQGLPWLQPAVIDTALLARRVLTRDEVANCKLATLAGYFAAHTTPNHRALADARATVDVLHGLIGRLSGLGVFTLPELRAFSTQVSPAQRRKRVLADPLPHSPGVYVFCDVVGQPLYVGTSADLRTRVRQYFLSSERRTRMGEMVGLAETIRHLVCAHSLEAQVRELRMIVDLKPRYNRRSKNSDRVSWLKLTPEPFPRLAIARVRKADGGHYFGPLRSRRQAEQLRDALHDAVPLRQCSDRLTPQRPVRAACSLAGMGRCGAPCEDAISVSSYADLVLRVVTASQTDPRMLIEPLVARLHLLSAAQRYEEAASLRDRVATLVRACARTQSLTALTRIAELVAARPDGSGGWELVVVRSGRLVGADTAPRGVPVWPRIEAMIATAEIPPAGTQTAAPGQDPVEMASAWSNPAAVAAESELILRWLEQPGVRLVRTTDSFYSPARGAAGLQSWLARREETRRTDPFPDRRSVRLEARPARGGLGSPT